MLNVIILTLEFSIAGKCFFLGSFVWRFSCGILTVLGGGTLCDKDLAMLCKKKDWKTALLIAVWGMCCCF